jgi:hypothetical protein
MLDLQEATLTKKERDLLERSLRQSRKKTKINLKGIPARDQCQTPPYAILPLMSYIPRDWIIWESAASSYGFLGEAFRAIRGQTVIESGLELDGTDFLTAPVKDTAQVQITNPPYSIKYDWIERSYDNRQPFALLMPFDTWAAAKAQTLFQRYGMNIIILNRRIQFHMPNMGWKGKGADYSVAWFTWGLPFLKEPVTYGYVPLTKHLPEWMVRPEHKSEITKGARSMQDLLTIRHAADPLQWPAPTQERRR